MIISASRRTDIPAYYSPWFFRRLKEGYVYTRNPMNYRQVSKIILTPENVDGIVFWSKNPAPLLAYRKDLGDYRWYVQYTLNSYGEEIEPGLPKIKRRIETFHKLAEAAGPQSVIFRYDPILLSNQYTPDFHIEQFERIARQLKGYTERCVISFIDMYACMKGNAARLGMCEVDLDNMRLLAEAFVRIGKDNGFTVESCAEQGDLEELGVKHGVCIDAGLLERIGGWPIKVRKDKNQRSACGCAASRDIGMYNTCPAGCAYCYAVHNEGIKGKGIKEHRLDGEFLTGILSSKDKIYEHR